MSQALNKQNGEVENTSKQFLFSMPTEQTYRNNGFYYPPKQFHSANNHKRNSTVKNQTFENKMLKCIKIFLIRWPGLQHSLALFSFSNFTTRRYISNQSKHRESLALFVVFECYSYLASVFAFVQPFQFTCSQRFQKTIAMYGLSKFS